MKSTPDKNQKTACPMRRSLKAALLLLALGWAGAPGALSTDKDQPINIEADTAEIDDKKGISIYRGNVVVTQGTLRLDADIVTAYTPDRQLQKVVAEGNPARYKQRPDKKDEDMRARARRMEYYANTGQLILYEGAHLWHEGNEFSGNRIEYDTRADVVQAAKAPTGKERVQVVIPPKGKNASGAKKP
ncbi:MAG: lipopolysaccharide transport periplasmic protein LptA [Gammaproteobacteria bacterium]|nr:MAG: lipopolysaccharide transport periplasmic protein LptA [Gammaproteobacteria bacterium]